MEKSLALFPLNIVVFPNEHLNLHIFEPRYKHLVNDCLEDQTTFGIPSYVLNKIEYCTEVEILEVTKRYDDGRLDIKTLALDVFKIINYENPWLIKEYAGGDIVPHEYLDDADPTLAFKIIEKVIELISWLQLEAELKIDHDSEMHEFIHKIGLKPEEEYKLLTMPSQKDQQIYILQHLKQLLPMLDRAESAREKIRLNGHFKYIDPINF
ncbi:MAG: Lon protease-like protein [Cyclobacteriaceae bacterium]|jgi:Lon protease-like protein